ncbi:hypothetical protein AMR74_15655 [Halorubrum tropicale]|uniref:CAAX prenyl protease 2/Lysostaphin resistance protein A-like domain-containing protein n=1 Tax=Halorubrum tropicale TaxID=1765655 RepID=A0A0M9AQ16_9EURY|nr:hypothetical protein AMR74_15655 [Halorubrum tropicale]
MATAIRSRAMTLGITAYLGLALLWDLLPQGAHLIVEGGPPSGTVPDWFLLLAFGFAVESFQEETLFRGFLQTELADRYGEWSAVVLLAGAFSAAHVGYYPFSAWYLFAAGLVYGWLRKRRGRLLVPSIPHGLLG